MNSLTVSAASSPPGTLLPGPTGERCARHFRATWACSYGDWTIPYVAALEGDRPSPAAVRATESLLRARLVERGTDGRFRFHDLVAAYARRVANAGLSAEEARAVPAERRHLGRGHGLPGRHAHRAQPLPSAFPGHQP